MKKLTTSMKVTAADSAERTITGTIVTFDETGNTSIGKTQFAKGSIEAQPVLLNLEHDRARRIGKTLSMEQSDTEIVATFKIAETTAGTDALVEAAEGLRDGFSVEVSINEYETLKDGTVRILAGELTGVALTSEPAIRSARVSEVAASEEDSASNPDAEETTNEGDEVDNTVTQADAVETVEAAQSVTAAATAVGGFTAKPRIEVTAAKYMESTIKASLGDEEAKRYVMAADNTTDNAGFNPTPQMTTIINGLATMVRPSIDAISRGVLPAAGLTFEIPKVTTLPSAAAADEGAGTAGTDAAGVVGITAVPAGPPAVGEPVEAPAEPLNPNLILSISLLLSGLSNSSSKSLLRSSAILSESTYLTPLIPATYALNK